MKKFYRVSIWGYGAEQYIAKITKEQYEFWSGIKQRYYDYENTDHEAEEIWESLHDNHYERDDIPENAKFNEESVHEWGDFVYQGWGAFLNSATLNIQEVDSPKWGADLIGDDVDYEVDGDALLNEEDEVFGGIEFGPDDETYPLGISEESPVLYWVQAEKGTFFETYVEIEGEFDPKKLTFIVEDIDAEYKILGLKYDGEELYNDGGDTRTKSEDFYFFKDGEK